MGRNPHSVGGPRSSSGGPRSVGGFSIVELMVGMAVGLLIAAGGVMLLTGNLRDNRSLLLEARLMQDLGSVSV